MALDDRDRNFEKALARHLRSSASGADSNPLGAVPGAACPDPEILAAYHDGSLTAEERTFWKQHVLACENCQLVLAHLETPLELPVNVAANEPVLATQRAASSSSSAAPVRAARHSPMHGLRWLWLVPAGAVAASFIAWISLHQQKPMQVSQPSSVEVAQNRPEQAAPAPLASAPAPSSSRAAHVAPSERKEKDQASQAPVAGAPAVSKQDRDSASRQLNNRVQLSQNAPNQSAAGTSHGPFLSQQNQQRQQQMTSNGAAGGARGALLDQKKAVAAPSPKPASPSSEGRAKQPSPPPPSGEQSFVADETVAPPPVQKTAPAPQPAPPSSGDKTEPTRTDAGSSLTQTVESSAPSGSLKKMRAFVSPQSYVFSSPDRKHFWRIGPAGSLEFSKNSGSKWTAQLSGVTADLLAGSAPSAQVAWVVGRAGTILLTTDGGSHWTKLDSPVTSDLVGVLATDATHAVIWLPRDSQSVSATVYQTTDGGLTWSSAPYK